MQLSNNCKNIFVLAGRTGGPIMPLLPIVSQLKNIHPVLIGVKNGFEQKVVKPQFPTWSFEILPEAKFELGSFKKSGWGENFVGLIKFIFSLFIIFYSIIKSIFLFIKYKPSIVLTAGSFLNIPVINAMRLSNLVGLTKIKLIVHQQDPEAGKANKMVVGFANLVSVAFEITTNTAGFDKAEVLPNLVSIDRFEPKNLEYNYKNLYRKNQKLAEFLSTESSNPLLFVFGGGSGAEFINNWVQQNLNLLLKRFKVLHATGILQSKSFKDIKASNYFMVTELAEEQALALSVSDLVICRAGMGSISELIYLKKPAFLVPIPHSHQEYNAEQVRKFFYILNQRDSSNWIETINREYPIFFQDIKYYDNQKIIDDWKDYIAKIQKLI